MPQLGVIMLSGPGARAAGWVRRLAHDEAGAILVEFAVVLPVLLVMFLGGYVICDMISCYRKVTITTRTLVDLVSRNISPTQTNPLVTSGAQVSATTLTTYMNASNLVLSPFTSTTSTLQVAMLRVCDASNAYVVWSQAQVGASTASSTITPGTIVPVPSGLISATMVPSSSVGSADVCNNLYPSSGSPVANETYAGQAGAYLFVALTSYVYTPLINYGNAGPTTMSDQLYMSPRLN